jgi:hypothetical protein
VADLGLPYNRQLRKEYAPASNGKLRVWANSSFWRHQFAPTLVDLPQGCLWGHLEPDALDLLVQEWLQSLVCVNTTRVTGLSKFEQIAEPKFGCSLAGLGLAT